MLRAVLEFVLMLVIARSFWRVVGGVMQGLGVTPGTRVPNTDVPRSDVPERGVPMARDPVCGTFVVPERAISIADGRQRVYFCSAACRDQYRARSA
jgi:YHS domain-containing protein